MFKASSRAPSRLPLPFLVRRHPLRAALLRWSRLRHWLHPETVPSASAVGTRKPLRGKKLARSPRLLH